VKRIVKTRLAEIVHDQEATTPELEVIRVGLTVGSVIPRENFERSQRHCAELQGLAPVLASDMASNDSR
jgi:hypothetical protein